MLDKRRSDIGSERVFMNSVVKKCFVVFLFANFIGLVGCEISDYSELRRARDERAVETNVDEPAVASLAPKTSDAVSGPPVAARLRRTLELSNYLLSPERRRASRLQQIGPVR